MNGVAIIPSSSKDYRNLTKLLNDIKKKYHTYAIPEDQTTRAVIKGVPTNITVDDATKDLACQGLKAVSVHRMTSRQDKRPLPLVLVKAKKEDKGTLFQITRCCHLVVKVERQRQQPGETQCHRCQRFGHTQSYCTAEAKCVKCGGNYHSAECKKAREEPVKCVNCGGPHLANYHGCKNTPTKPR